MLNWMDVRKPRVPLKTPRTENFRAAKEGTKNSGISVCRGQAVSEGTIYRQCVLYHNKSLTLTYCYLAIQKLIELVLNIFWCKILFRYLLVPARGTRVPAETCQCWLPHDSLPFLDSKDPLAHTVCDTPDASQNQSRHSLCVSVTPDFLRGVPGQCGAPHLPGCPTSRGLHYPPLDSRGQARCQMQMHRALSQQRDGGIQPAQVYKESLPSHPGEQCLGSEPKLHSHGAQSVPLISPHTHSSGHLCK